MRVMIAVSGMGELALIMVAQVGGELPVYLQILERLGSFALVAFLVWYFVKYALPQQRQDYIQAQEAQRKDHLAAQAKQEEREIDAKNVQREHYLTAAKEQRTDFLAAIERMQLSQDKMANSVQELAKATYSHVNRAEEVWKRQEEKNKLKEIK